MMNMLMTLMINMVMMFLMSVDEYIDDECVVCSQHVGGDEYIGD